jgi:uncharacterized oligopeptide transporter (OPT) family protein
VPFYLYWMAGADVCILSSVPLLGQPVSIRHTRNFSTHAHSYFRFEVRVVVYAGATLIALVSFWTLNGLKRG